MNQKVLVSGCYDLLHPGHIEFFRQASQYGELFVCVGSDETILKLKNHKTLLTQDERVYMINAIKYVHNARVSTGCGLLDFLPELDEIKPDILLVNEDGASEEKKQLCKEQNIEYVVLKRTPPINFPPRSSSSLKEDVSK